MNSKSRIFKINKKKKKANVTKEGRLKGEVSQSVKVWLELLSYQHKGSFMFTTILFQVVKPEICETFHGNNRDFFSLE